MRVVACGRGHCAGGLWRAEGAVRGQEGVSGSTEPGDRQVRNDVEGNPRQGPMCREVEGV